MLLLLYSLCGLALGFIVGYSYGWERRSLTQHGKDIDPVAFFRRLLFGWF